MNENVFKLSRNASRKSFVLARVSNCLTLAAVLSISGLGLTFFAESAHADIRCESVFKTKFGVLIPLKHNTSLTIDAKRLEGVEERSVDGDRRYVKMVDFLQRLPELDSANLHDLKELSIETGRALGLSRVQVDEILLNLIESGAIGGPLQLTALTRNVDSGNLYANGLYLWSKDDFRKLGERIGMGAAVKTPAQRESLDREVSVMVGVAKQYSNVSVPTFASEAILAIWYKGTLEQVVAAGIKTAPTKLQWRLAKVPRAMKKNMWFTLGAATFTGGVGHFLGFSEVVTYAFDAFYVGAAGTGGGELLTRSGLATWLQEFPTRKLRRMQGAIKSLKDVVAAPLAIEQASIQLEPLKAFSLETGYSPLSLALRAETAKLQIELEVYGEINAQVHGSGAEFLVERIAPLVRLANETADLQSRSLRQTLEAIPHGKPESKPGDSSMIRSPVSAYRAVVRATEVDFEYTLNALETLKTPLLEAKAIAQAAGQIDLSEKIDFLMTFIDQKKPLLRADFETRLEGARKKLTTLNRSYVQ